MRARIAEVFDSVQGEGIYLGEKQLFVRFFGCNLSCRYCDTKLDRFSEYEPEELFNELKIYQDDYHSVSFTGGEPLLQIYFLKEILRLTRADGFKNYLETNGTLWHHLKEVIDYVDIVAMDLKLSSSTGMPANLCGLHRRFLEVASQKEVFIKAIICQTTQEEDLREAIRLIKEINPALILVLQPNSFDNRGQVAQKLERFKDICAEEDITACTIPQIHKIARIR